MMGEEKKGAKTGYGAEVGESKGDK